MTSYLLISSRDPLDSRGADSFYDLASRLASAGSRVTLFLVQNGVFPARPGCGSESVEAVARSGVEVLADDFSLRERGIAADRLSEGVKPAALDVVVDLLAEGRKALWH